MITAQLEPRQRVGFSLIETALALAVLVAAVPMVFLAMGEAGKSAMASEAESRGCRIVPLCLEEMRASREGRSRWFPSSTIGEMRTTDGDFRALAFSADGKVVGVLSEEMHGSGASRLDNQSVRYIATMTSSPRESDPHPTMRNIRIVLEYPAAAPAARRGKLEFQTLMP